MLSSHVLEYVLAVASAVAIAWMNQSAVLDDPGYFTPQGGMMSADVLLDSVKSGKSGLGRNKLRQGIEMIREG